MSIPRWLSNLFGSTPEEVPTDSSANLTKLANQSELIQNLITDKPVEVQAEATPVTQVCPECERPLPSWHNGLCDKCNEAEKQASIQPEKVSLVAELEKEAGAYELGDSEEQTANKSHEAQIKAASDFALAEMLTEMHLQGNGVQEQWFEEFPKVLKKVQKNRRSAEKELLKATPPPAVLDRMKFLAESMENSHNNEFEPTDAESLYKPLFELEGKQSWEKSKYKWKDEPLTEKEQYAAQMPQETGPGREAEDTRGHQAPRSVTAAEVSPDDIQMVPQDKFLVHYSKIEGGEKYFRWFNTKEAAQAYMDSMKVTEASSSAKIKDFSKSFTVKSQETVQKEAAHLVHTTPTGWYVTVKLDATDNPDQLIDTIRTTEGVSKVSRYYDHLQVRLDGVGLDEKAASAIVQSALTPADKEGFNSRVEATIQVAQLHKNALEIPQGPKCIKCGDTWDTIDDPMELCAECKVPICFSCSEVTSGGTTFCPDCAKGMQNLLAANTNAQVQKKADIASPWAVVRKDDQDVIARITPEEVIKKSKEKTTKEVAKKASQIDDVAVLVQRWLTKEAAGKEKKDKLPPAADQEPAQSLEGLTPEEQELWTKHWALAFRWAMSDPLSRRLGKSLTRQVAMQALLRVIRAYDPTHESGAKFESYLFRAIHNELLTGFKTNKTVKERLPDKFVNLDQPISEGDQMYESTTLQDLIEDVNEATPEEHLDRAQEADIALEVVRRAKEQLTGRHKEIMDLLAQGYTISNIAEMLHFSIPNIVRYRKSLAETLERIMKEVKKSPPKPSLRREEPIPEVEETQEGDGGMPMEVANLFSDRVMTHPDANI